MSEDLTAVIIETALKKFNIFSLKPYQLLVVQRILEQDSGLYEIRDQLVILPTGTGKSLCFLLPAVLCRGITIIVFPLLALMNDQMNKLKALGIDSVCLRGGQTHEQRRSAFEKLKHGTKIVITNPETLCQNAVLRQFSNLKISLFVCDEAHVISQWGKDFRPDYTRLHDILPLLKPDQILAFTATAGEQTVNDIISCLFSRIPLIVKGDADRENIFYKAFPVHERDFSTVRLLSSCQRPAIVFCPTRALTFNLCRLSKLSLHDIPMRYYHAGLTKIEREKLETWFLNSHDGILFATNAYGMGIDKPDIRTVIHHTLSRSVEAFLQESGRAGRDGNPSFSFVLVDSHDRESDKPLQKIFCSSSCRRTSLLSFLGQEKDGCSGCDVCDDSVLLFPEEDAVILEAVRKNPLKYSKPLLRSLLCASRNIAFVPPSFRFDLNYGRLGNFNEDCIDTAIDDLVSQEKLKYLGLRRKAPLLFYRFSKAKKH